MELGLKGKRAVITGASEGIGFETAKLLLKQGARVAICGRSEVKLEQAASKLRCAGIEEGALLVQSCDVGNAGQLRDFLNHACRQMGGLDILINNAGFMAGGKLEDVTDELWDTAMDVNLKSVFVGIQSGAKLMKDSGGVIINAASYAAVIPSVGGGVYAAAKAGVVSLIRTAASELAPYGIRVVGYIPGLIDTALNAANIEANAKQLKDSISLHRFGKPEEVAKAIAFLASDAASYITGTCIEVSGGKYATQNPQKVWGEV